MTDLIARLEQAEGPSRELMVEAFHTCFPEGLGWLRFSQLLDAEAWEQAALTLVPEEQPIALMSVIDIYHFGIGADELGEAIWYATAKTPALALAIAALKAKGGEG